MKHYRGFCVEYDWYISTWQNLSYLIHRRDLHCYCVDTCIIYLINDRFIVSLWHPMIASCRKNPTEAPKQSTSDTVVRCIRVYRDSFNCWNMLVWSWSDLTSMAAGSGKMWETDKRWFNSSTQWGLKKAGILQVIFQGVFFSLLCLSSYYFLLLFFSWNFIDMCLIVVSQRCFRYWFGASKTTTLIATFMGPTWGPPGEYLK